MKTLDNWSAAFGDKDVFFFGFIGNSFIQTSGFVDINPDERILSTKQGNFILGTPYKDWVLDFYATP